VTQTGISLGTPQYMSPEQATGDRALDGRTDIYSLAAVLYEMLVGDAPHPGSTAQVIIAKVIAERPTNVRVIRPAVPVHVASAIERALEKFPADRWPTAREFAEALETPAPATAAPAETLQAATEELRAELRRRHRVPRRVTMGVVGVLTAIAAVLLWQGLGTRRGAEPATPVRFTLAFPPNERVATTMGSTVAISPDGNVLAYAGVGSGGQQQLFVRTLDEIRARPLPGTEDGERPFFSPDGQWLGFVTRGHVRKMLMSGGAPIALPEMSHINGASWGRDDAIVISSQDRLVTISANGGPVRILTQLDSAAGETGHRWPRILADGKTVLFTSWRTGLSDARLAVASLETGQTTPLNLEGTFPLGVLDGQLIYASASGALMAVPFDARRLRVSGTPKVVVDRVVLGADGAAHAELAPTGSLIYQIGRPTMRLIARDVAGNARPIIDEPRQYQFPRFSPDGSRIAVTVVTENATHIWTFNVASGTLTRLTSEGSANDRPEWTPDGTRIIYSSNRADGFALWWQPADGSGRAEPLLGIPGTDLMEGMLSRDQQWVVYRGGQEIWTRRLQGDTTPRRVASSAAFAPRVSPDGRWIAYSSEESGVAHVYVRPFPDLGARFQISIDGGTEPVWSRDGRRLYYRRNRVIAAATLSTTPSFTVTAREDLFEGDFVFQAVHAEYDVTPDGRQILLPQFVGDVVQTIVVQNWLSELRARTATRSN
jgi:serine/threonine-protein kinase